VTNDEIEVQVNGRSHTIPGRKLVTHEAVMALACWEGAKGEVRWRPYMQAGDETKELKPGDGILPSEGLVFYVRR
jgi:hypothetical protein